MASHAHFALTPHEICSEHGDLTDVVDPGHAGGHATEPGTWIGRTGAGDWHGRHHCVVVLSRRLEFTLVANVGFEGGVAADAMAVVAPYVSDRRSIPILRLAPTHSPPSA
jgi:hypothetical protein